MSDRVELEATLRRLTYQQMAMKESIERRDARIVELEATCDGLVVALRELVLALTEPDAINVHSDPVEHSSIVAHAAKCARLLLLQIGQSAGSAPYLAT